MVRQANIKEANRKAVLDIFLKEGICTKKELIEKTKLSSGTCTNMIRLLLEEGAIVRIDDRASHHGRSSKQYQYIKKQACYLVMYKGKKITVDEKGDITKDNHYTAVICLEPYSQELERKLEDDYGVPIYFFNEAQAMLGYDLSQRHTYYPNEICIFVDKGKNVKIAMAIDGRLIHGKNHRFGDLSQLEIITATKTKGLVSQSMQMMITLLDPDKILTCVRKKIDVDKLVHKIKTSKPPLVDNVIPTKKHLIEGLLYLVKE